MNRLLKNLLICICALGLSVTMAYGEELEPWGEFLPTGQYYTLVDPEGNVLLETGRLVYLQDQYLTEHNQLYEVIKVDEDTHIARTELVEEVELEIEGIRYTLHHEDSIRIPGGAMHRWYNPTEQPVQVVFAVTPPSF